MQSNYKVLIIAISILFFILGCYTKPKQEVNPKYDKYTAGYENQQKFKILNSMLPSSLDRGKYWIICRFGSIEYSGTSTILCLSKSDIRKNKISSEYFIINNKTTQIDKISEVDISPNSLHFSFKLSNPNNKNIDLSKLKKLKIDHEFFDYQIKSTQNNPGEGYCNNLYVIFNPNDNYVRIVDYNSDIRIRTFLMSLYRQISPSEYIQAFSLESNCNKHDHEIERFVNHENIESFDFKIIHGENGKYW